MTADKSFTMLIIATLVCACGGGGGGDTVADTGIGGSGGGAVAAGRVVGTFQSTGSIIVNDRTLSTSSAQFEIEDGSSETDLEEGQRLVVFADFSTNEAERVIYRSDVKGPVTDITILDPLSASAQLTVLGQPVVTNATTRFDGITPNTVANGDLLEVSGSPNADGVLVATFVERKTTLTEYKAIGAIENLDTASMTFELGGLTVDYSSATLSEFAGNTVSDGQRVEITVAPGNFTAPLSAVAGEVELLTTDAFEAGEEVEFEGFVDSFSSTTSFDVEGLGVTTNASTEYVNGTSGSLALNVKIEVEGVINTTGTLVAARIIIKPTGAVRVEGTVASVDESAMTVTTEVGLTFEVRALTTIEDDRDGVEPFGLADLQSGDYVELRGFLDRQVLVAAELEREDFDTRTRMRGPVTAEDAAAGTIQIQGITVTGVSGFTVYETNQTQFHAEVEEGTFVEAEWDPFISTNDPANNLSIED